MFLQEDFYFFLLESVVHFLIIALEKVHSYPSELELMDCGLSSDSDSCNSATGFVDFDLQNGDFSSDFMKFNTSDFPNLHTDIGS